MRPAIVVFALAFPLGAADLPAGPGRDILVKACDTCHKAADIGEYRHTRNEWTAAIDRMMRRGAKLTGPESDVLIEYLAANFPKIEDPARINVNQATATELQVGLGLTPEEAAAIVRYRERNPEFRSWGDLLPIYGVDGRKIQAAKDKMSF